MNETQVNNNNDVLITKDHHQYITFYVDSMSTGKTFNFTVLTSDIEEGKWNIHFSCMVNGFLIPDEVKLKTSNMGKFFKCECDKQASVTVYHW
jgi:hypothetical protein